MFTVCSFFYVKLVLNSESNGSVAEWSKALVLGTSLLGGVGSNPTTASGILYVVENFCYPHWLRSEF